MPCGLQLADHLTVYHTSKAPQRWRIADNPCAPATFGAFSGIFGHFSPGLPKIESEIHISTPSSRYSQFPFPKQKTVILRLWAGSSTNHQPYFYEKSKIKNQKLKFENGIQNES
jgi:hypothetical protein